MRSLEQAADVALWWKQFAETNNETFLPLFFDRHKHLILVGGGGSGKSITAGRKVLERATTEAGHRVLVVRAVAKTLRESCFDQLKTQAHQYYEDAIYKIPSGKSSDMYMLFKNGSEILFAGLDDVEKLKSIHDITMIWIEEGSEITESDFNQLDIRLRGKTKYYKQIILTMNPISATHWCKARFFDRKDERVRTHLSTYLDNRFLPAEDRLTLEAFKETDPYYYQVYCLGQWGVLASTIFNREKLMRRLTELKKPTETGSFVYRYDGLEIRDFCFTQDAVEERDTIKVFRRPEEGHPYVIGADTAGEGSDWFVAHVIDNSDGKQVAVYRTRTDEDIFARQLYCLGRWYNDALIGPEVNFSTHPVKELERLHYPKLYLREVEDSLTRKFVPALGFRTDRLTRPLILSELVGLLREHPEVLEDETTIQELLSFARNAKGRPEAVAGAHDDCVMALAITYHIRSQQRATVLMPRGKKAKWEEDMFEDYENATQEERKRLLAEWGNPF